MEVQYAETSKTHLRDEQAEDVEEAIHSAEVIKHSAATGVLREITSDQEDDEMQQLSQANS